MPFSVLHSLSCPPVVSSRLSTDFLPSCSYSRHFFLSGTSVICTFIPSDSVLVTNQMYLQFCKYFIPVAMPVFFSSGFWSSVTSVSLLNHGTNPFVYGCPCQLAYTSACCACVGAGYGYTHTTINYSHHLLIFSVSSRPLPALVFLLSSPFVPNPSIFAFTCDKLKSRKASK